MKPNPAVAPNWQFGIREPSRCGVVPAEAGTHGKHIQKPLFLPAWIPAFAGMTPRSARLWAFALRLKLDDSAAQGVGCRGKAV